MIVPICCGEELTTPFCPNCGVRNDSDPGGSLLAHIRKHIATYDAWRSMQPASEESDNKAGRRIKTLDRWKSWESWVMECQAKAEIDFDAVLPPSSLGQALNIKTEGG